ncbi:MAG: hypothetical protein ACXVB5_00565 [Isosphaeraceae bacterium]
MLAHYMVRRVMHDAAVVASHDPDRFSFTDSLRGLRRQSHGTPCVVTETWYQLLLREVRRQELRPRRDPWYARVIERKMSNRKKQRPEHRNPPQSTKLVREAVVQVNQLALPLAQ